MKPISILILDDVPYVRQLIANEVSVLQGIAQIYEAGDAAAAVIVITMHQPEIIILDINVPGGIFESVRYNSGIDVLRVAKTSLPHSKVIMLTNNANEYYRRECKKSGADYFFDKTNEFDLFLERVQCVVEDPVYWLSVETLQKPTILQSHDD